MESLQKKDSKKMLESANEDSLGQKVGCTCIHENGNP